tara:strand:- start:1828 stop:2619 length:792 start_codon:yes stop_codon:yes gene_type:complete
MKKIAILIGGWHYPKGFYDQLLKLKCPDGFEFETFIVSHRDVDLPIVHEEKLKALSKVDRNSDNGRMDYELYGEKLTKDYLVSNGIKVVDAENKYGDYYFITQWLDKCDYTDYEYVCFLHDDTYLLNDFLIDDIVEGVCTTYDVEGPEVFNPNWLMLFNSNAPGSITPRGSFAFFKKEFFKEFGNLEYTVDGIGLDRTDKVDTPTSSRVLKEWNTTTRMLMRKFIDKGMIDRIFKLSDRYRISNYMIEAERGMMTPIKVWGDE